jgi:hypothetical protein
MFKKFTAKRVIAVIAAILVLSSVYFIYAERSVQDCINFCGKYYGHDDELFAACYYGCIPSPDPQTPN